MPRHFIGGATGRNQERRDAISHSRSAKGDAILKEMDDILKNGKKTSKSPEEVLAEMDRLLKSQGG